MVARLDADRVRVALPRRGVRGGGRQEAGAAPRDALFYKLDSVGWTTDRRKHIYVVDLDGGEPRQVTDGDCEDGDPAWTPDGKRIVFSALRGDRWDTELVKRLYVVDAGGGEPKQLTGDDASFESPSSRPTARARVSATAPRTAPSRTTDRSA